MPQFEILGSLMRNLNSEFVSMYYILLPVFFMLAVVVAWFRLPSGSPDFLDILKRAMVATILLIAFPDISQAIIGVADGITEKIDKLNSLDTIIRMAKEKAATYSQSSMSSLLMFNALFMATLSFLSYLLLYIARYLMIALYQFFWVFFTVSAPLLLLFNLFSVTSQITVNLFKGMIEVASWKIVWAILGAMLAALSFGDIYRIEGDYVTLIVMNFIIAIAMLMTPMMVRSLIGGGLQQMSSSLGAATVATFATAPMKLTQVGHMGRNAYHHAGNFVRNNFNPNAGSGGPQYKRADSAASTAPSKKSEASITASVRPDPNVKTQKDKS